MKYLYYMPDFLKNQSADEIHRRMLEALPNDIDKSENQIPWDFTRPAALEKAEFVEFELNRAIQVMFPHWAWGEWLDLHADMQGLSRKEANKASGNLTVSAKVGTTINKGFKFATAANLTSSVIFEASEEVAFDGEPDEKGFVTLNVPIIASEGGKIGNVPPDTVILMVKPDSRINYITNSEAIEGGTEEESDDELRERVIEEMRRGVSFTGCDADYVRWAKEVPGVGEVVVVPEWDDPELPENFHWIDVYGQRRCAGAVRLFVVDKNGDPANQQILDDIYNYIANPQDPYKRLAPIGAKLTVSAPVAFEVDIKANVILKETENLEKVTERVKANIEKYWITAAEERLIKYVYIGAVLAKTEGIADYSDLTIDGGVDNISFNIGEFPVIGEVILNE